MNLKEIYKRVTPTAKGNIIGSVTASIRESRKNPELVEVKIVFVKDRHSKNWLAVLSTNTAIGDEEIIRIYGIFSNRPETLISEIRVIVVHNS